MANYFGRLCTLFILLAAHRLFPTHDFRNRDFTSWRHKFPPAPKTSCPESLLLITRRGSAEQFPLS